MRTIGIVKLVFLICLSVDAQIQRQDVSASKKTNEFEALENQANGNTTIKDQLAEPSITRVHQVWTSSSSDSLDELSPEIIGKLRNDVPFLAAYALRPRLVGAKASGMTSRIMDTQLQAPSTLTLAGLTDGKSLQTAASSPESRSLGPKIGDFSEFNVETSSTSKSEHHHMRKTNLKRKPTNGYANNFPNNRRNSSNNNRKPGGDVRKLRTQKEKRLQRLESKDIRQSKRKSLVLKKRLNLKKPMVSVIKHGRYYQEQSLSSAANQPNEGDDTKTMNIETKSVGDQTTIMSGDSNGKTSPSSSKKTPFYSSVRPASDEPRNGLDKTEDKDDRSVDQNEVGRGEDLEIDDEDDREDTPPKRVGDDDVEEDGDTVTVEPKSDGVDDDPIIEPSSEDEEGDFNPDEENKARKDEPREVEGAVDEGGADDDRVRRINREWPHSKRPLNDEADSGDRSVNPLDGNTGTAAGGGLGATIGGASESGGSRANGKPISGDKEADDDNVSTNPVGKARGWGSRSGRGDSVEPGVEFAYNEDKDDVGKDKDKDDSPRADDTSQSEGAGQGDNDGSNRFGSADNEADFGSRRSTPRGRDPTKETGKPATGGSEDDADLDYRDELEERARKHGPKDGSMRDGHEFESEKSAGRRKPVDCDDSGGHHDDGHYHDHHHHHGDSIRWLQDAIPGEPGLDYPTLSRINTSDFNCRAQKWPGYYADVEARCQVFHICQADGRQDSFLCPNGTIFSQRARVCVWWNSFDCEDAPKFYELNAKLYATPEASDGPLMGEGVGGRRQSDLRPLDGTRLMSKGGSASDDGSSSLESLIRDMMRKGTSNVNQADTDLKSAAAPDGLSMMRGVDRGLMMNSNRAASSRDSSRSTGEIGPDDEASIQRKSSDEEGSAAFSRLRKANAEPRRKRRASVRQAPPKLKSRRVSRNSRRRKLRHGIKPKRRA